MTDRIGQLAQIFAIDVAAYAVMSNHYHLVLHLAKERASAWSNEEVLRRWYSLFTGLPRIRRHLDKPTKEIDSVELDEIKNLSVVIRERLQDLSWFIRLLNEYISRKANAEDECRGRFWEGRFKSQALLDLPALISAMAYVDLNPIRAGMADTLQTSLYTSAYSRISGNGASLLMPFNNHSADNHSTTIPFRLDDYIKLVEWRGGLQRPDKRGVISELSPSALDQLGVDPETFLTMSGQLMRSFGSAIGSSDVMAEHCSRNGLKYLRGTPALKRASE